MCKLSIIVPVYNMAGDGKLEYGIRSLINQTISDYEIIAVDDKSTDNSLQILRDFEKQYPDIFRVIESPENARQGAARNKGILAAKGKYLGFMDSDDWVLPDAYECAIKKAEETGADVVGFDRCIASEHTMMPSERIIGNTMEQTGIIDQEKRALFIRMPGPFCAKIYKREFFSNPTFSFPEKIAYEDNAMTVDIAMRIKHYEHVPEVKGFYYQHAASTTSTVSQKNFDDRMTSMRIMLKTARDWNVFDKYHQDIEYLFAKNFYSTTLFSYMQSNIKQTMKFVRALGKEVKAEFPDFLHNPYFLESLDAEGQKWVKLQQKSTLLFFACYKFKKFYRKKRYGKW